MIYSTRLLANVKLEGWAYDQLSEMFDAEISKRLLAAAVANEKSLLKIETAFKQSAIILDILEACNIPKSAGYRMINQLVEDGLLTEDGHAETSDGRKVSKHTALFQRQDSDRYKGRSCTSTA
jgi:hypothetical protein